MGGLNSSVITGKCVGCAAYREELREARRKLAAVEVWNKGKKMKAVSRTLDRILKGGD